jgi:hypothetical protein
MQEEEVGVDTSGAEGETGIETTADGEATAESGIGGRACTTILSPSLCVVLGLSLLRRAILALIGLIIVVIKIELSHLALLLWCRHEGDLVLILKQLVRA